MESVFTFYSKRELRSSRFTYLLLRQPLAETLDISPLLSKFPYQVSGGQRQRCACARAIAVNPDIILADEPTGALDSYSTKQLLNAFLLLREEYRATILMATHDALSASYCDRILFLKDGRIRQILERGEQTKHVFFTAILDAIAEMEETDRNVS